MTSHVARTPVGNERGQSLAEFALILPVFALCLLGMLELGLGFNHYMTVEYATREGARTGAALGDGGSKNCIGGVDANMIDGQIIAAVQRILKSPGSPIAMGNVTDIRIYKADSAGRQVGANVNVWTYTPGAGPDIDPGLGIDRLDFSQQSAAWTACSRNTGPSADSIGVRIHYRYAFQTPLGAISSMFSNAPQTLLNIDDATVMALAPQT
ncbi:MAG: TadE family protein [Chloroflexota bacterium]